MYTRTRTFGAKYSNWILESQDGTTSIKYQITLKHNFCLNDLLNKSNRTTLQSYKEERTFGTPCILHAIKVVHVLSFSYMYMRFLMIKAN